MAFALHSIGTTAVCHEILFACESLWEMHTNGLPFAGGLFPFLQISQRFGARLERIPVNDGDYMQTNQTTIPMTESSGFTGAISIDEFCQRYSIGRSSAYAEIRDGNLPLRKCRGRSLI